MSLAHILLINIKFDLTEANNNIINNLQKKDMVIEI